MKRQFLLSCLAAGAALTLLGGCASEYDSGYYGSAYYGNGYYGPDYDSSIYYGGTYYGPGYIPRGGYGGGYRRDWHGDRDRVRRDGDNRRGDGEHRDFRRGDNDGNRNFTRSQPQQNVQPAQQAPSSGSGWRGGRDGGSQSGGFRQSQPGGSQSGGSQSGGSQSSSQSGDRPSGGPSGRFGHPGTPNNPL